MTSREGGSTIMHRSPRNKGFQAGSDGRTDGKRQPSQDLFADRRVGRRAGSDRALEPAASRAARLVAPSPAVEAAGGAAARSAMDRRAQEARRAVRARRRTSRQQLPYAAQRS